MITGIVIISTSPLANPAPHVPTLLTSRRPTTVPRRV